MNKIEKFMLPEHTNKLYTQEAISSVSLTKEIAYKINELIDQYNQLSTDDTSWKLEQESNIRKAVVYMKDNLLNSLNELMVTLRDGGFIDSRIEYHSKVLNERVNNLLSATISDGELIDLRVDFEGISHKTAGEAIRSQYKTILSIIYEEIDLIKNALNKRVKKNYCYRQLKEFTYPEGFTGTFKPLNIRTDGIKAITDFDKNKYKQMNKGVTFYVSPEGKWTNTGLTPNDPVGWYQAYNRSSDGDTIVMLKGEYRRDNLENSDIPLFNKSLNIIGECGSVWINGQQISPVYDDNTGLYRCAFQRNAKRLFDWELRLEYTKVNSINEVKTTPHSFYNGAEGLYVSNLPVTRFIVFVTIDSFRLTATGESKNYYVEGLTVYGGNSPIYTGGNSELNVTIVNCDLGFNCAGSSNGEPVIAIRNGNVIIADTLVHDSQYDGISYVTGCNFVELNCRCFNNGNVNDYSNGSTAHAGAKGIRVNGSYFNNRGGNVADVQEGTQSININCFAYDSTATTADYNHGFSIQQAGSTMWLYNCIAFGNIYDIFGVPDTEMICEKTSHTTDNFNFNYSGKLVDNEPKTLDYYMIRLNEHIIQQL